MVWFTLAVPAVNTVLVYACIGLLAVGNYFLKQGSNGNEELVLKILESQEKTRFIEVSAFAVLTAATGVFVYKSRHVPLRQLIPRLIFFLFLLSIIFTWFQLYQEKKAENLSIRHRLRNACQDETYFWQFVNWFRSCNPFYVKAENQCTAYVKAVTMDPFWSVSPLEALSVTVVNCFARPLGRLAYDILINTGIGIWLLGLLCLGIPGAFFTLVYFGHGFRFGNGLLSMESVRRQ